MCSTATLSAQLSRSLCGLTIRALWLRFRGLRQAVSGSLIACECRLSIVEVRRLWTSWATALSSSPASTVNTARRPRVVGVGVTMWPQCHRKDYVRLTIVDSLHCHLAFQGMPHPTAVPTLPVVDELPHEGR